MTEYGRIHTDGSRSGGQPVVDNAMLDALQKDAGLPHLPTQETYQFRMAVSGEGPLAYQWSDKPHRLPPYAAYQIARMMQIAKLKVPT